MARAAVKAGGLRAEDLGELLHAELAPGRVAGPPGCGGDLSRQVAAGGGPGLAARDPGLVVARRGKAGGGRVARRGPGAGVEQRGQVLAGSRGPRREGQRGRFSRGKTLVEVLWGGFCGDSGGEPGSEVRPRGRGPSDSGDGAGRGQAAGRPQGRSLSFGRNGAGSGFGGGAGRGPAAGDPGLHAPGSGCRVGAPAGWPGEGTEGRDAGADWPRRCDIEVSWSADPQGWELWNWNRDPEPCNLGALIPGGVQRPAQGSPATHLRP